MIYPCIRSRAHMPCSTHITPGAGHMPWCTQYRAPGPEVSAAELPANNISPEFRDRFREQVETVRKGFYSQYDAAGVLRPLTTEEGEALVNGVSWLDAFTSRSDDDQDGNHLHMLDVGVCVGWHDDASTMDADRWGCVRDRLGADGFPLVEVSSGGLCSLHPPQYPEAQIELGQRVGLNHHGRAVSMDGIIRRATEEKRDAIKTVMRRSAEKAAGLASKPRFELTEDGMGLKPVGFDGPEKVYKSVNLPKGVKPGIGGEHPNWIIVFRDEDTGEAVPPPDGVRFRVADMRDISDPYDIPPDFVWPYDVTYEAAPRNRSALKLDGDSLFLPDNCAYGDAITVEHSTPSAGVVYTYPGGGGHVCFYGPDGDLVSPPRCVVRIHTGPAKGTYTYNPEALTLESGHLLFPESWRNRLIYATPDDPGVVAAANGMCLQFWKKRDGNNDDYHPLHPSAVTVRDESGNELRWEPDPTELTCARLDGLPTKPAN